MDAYTAHDQARRRVEPAKGAVFPGGGAEQRSPFARDRARVLHSAALRRLAGKTQVVGPGEGAEVSGVPRTRLTHSLEVAQIGSGIAGQLGADADLVDTAGLAHDIGHPPFGHNGEDALDAAAADCGGFEGNAQTFRILTRLEPKVLTDGAGAVGLNLTRASLDAVLKYPWPASPGARKFGAYDEDVEAFAWVRVNAPPHRRCLEAQIMDWADDVAYSVHDVEDGVLAGRICLHVLVDESERTELAELAAKYFCDKPLSTVQDAAQALGELPVVGTLARRGYDGSLPAQAALKRLTSELVGRFASAAVSGTRAEYGQGPWGRYAADLAIPDRVAAEVALLKALALRYVMRDPRRQWLQRDQRQLLSELVEALASESPDALDAVFHPAWEAAADEAARRRVVIDQVATLTDAQAHAWHSWYLAKP